MTSRTKVWGTTLTTNVQAPYKCTSSTTTNYLTRTIGTNVLCGNMSGVDIPNFHAKKSRGELLPHTYFKKWEGQVSDSGVTNFTVQYSQATGCGQCSPSGGYFHPNALPNIPLPTEAFLTQKLTDSGADYTYLVQKAAADAYASGMDALTFLAELHKVRSMFANVVKNLSKLIISASKNSWTLSGRISQALLEIRYGWRILYYDLLDIQHYIETLDEQLERVTRSSGQTVGWTESVITPSTFSLQSGTVIVNIEHSYSVNYTLGVRGCVTADIRPPKLSFNPVVTGWEIVTFSFVIDWVINIGQWLQAMSFILLSSNYTASGGYKLTMQGTGVTYFTGVSGSKASCAGVQGVSSTRTVNGSLTIRNPASVSYRPLTQLRLDNWKIADLLALLRGRLR